MILGVASPVRLFREGACALLRACPEFDPVVPVVRGSDGSYVVEERPRAILVDAGYAALWIDELRHWFPATTMLAIFVEGSETETVRCIQSGIDGLLAPDAGPIDVLAAIDVIANNGFPCSPRLTGMVLRQLAHHERVSDEHVMQLSQRQQEILLLISAGFSNKMIARRLSITLSTVKNHVHSIFQRLGARNRTEAATRVQAMGVDLTNGKPDSRSMV